MDLFQLALITATFLCSLVAGFLLTFAVVIMPGLKSLPNGAFIRSFQAIDRIIQNGQPIFILIWAGSIIALIAATVLGFGQLDGVELFYIVLGLLVNLLGVHLPTITINLPLNNKLQTHDVKGMDEAALNTVRQNFEPRWNLWNVIRTVSSSATSLLLIILLFML